MNYRKIVKKIIKKSFQKREIRESRLLFSESARRMIRKHFDRRAWEFFELYPLVREALIPESEIREERLDQSFVRSLKKFVRSRGRIDKKPLSPLVINQLMESRSQIVRFLREIEKNIHEVDERGNPRGSLKINLRRLFDIYIPIIESAAKDKGAYISSFRRKSGEGNLMWPHFRQLKPKEVALEKLKDDDPEAYEALVERKEIYKKINENISEVIVAEGFEHSQSRIMGRLVHIGKDPVSGEKYIYDPFSEKAQGIPIEEWVSEKKKSQREKQELKKSNKKRGRIASYSEKWMQSRIQTLKNPNWEKEGKSNLKGKTEYNAITDDLSKSNRYTKVLPTRLLNGKKIVTEGRYEGIFLDDLVNEKGRLLEGSCYAYDEKLGRPVKVDPGTRDPFVTVANVVEKGKKIQKLYLRVPSRSEYTLIRKALRKLGIAIPSIEVQPDRTADPNAKRPRAIKVWFDPKDFTLIKKKVKSLTLSEEALKIIRRYQKSLAIAELATKEENLKFYNAENIGGFKSTLTHPIKGEVPFEFLTKQKEAMAWLDANGNKGVCALDTGIGKTLTAIGMMQKFIRDGFLEDPSLNGRFLYVAPGSLVGNIDKETRIFLEEEAGVNLRGRLDAVSYSAFAKGQRTKIVPEGLKKYWGDQPWDIEKYVAVFFDEAQKLKKLTWSASKAAFALNHPRKICLTASPMEKEPADAFVLSSICNNLDLTAKGKVGRENRKQMYKFKKRFCKVVGGRVVGVQDTDEDSTYDLDVWVKRNVFFADKRDVVESPLPELKKETAPIAMEKETGEIYRIVSKEVVEYLENVQRIIDTQKAKKNDAEWWKITGMKFNQIIKILNGLSNYPEITISRLSKMIELPNDEIHPALVKVVRKLRNKYTAQDLKSISENATNVKMEYTKDLITQRLSSIDSKSLIFTDDKELVVLTAKELSSSLGGYHAACLNDRILIFEGGQSIESVSVLIKNEVLDGIFPIPMAYGGERLSIRDQKIRERNYKKRQDMGRISTHPLPFTKRNYKLHPELPTHETWNPQISKSKWHKFVLDNIISNPELNFATCTLLGKAYSTGQNLQRFDTVIHLDRNNWNSEEMKQRTARAWRQGQNNAVEEYTIDSVFDDSIDNSESDPTLDQVKRLYQNMDASVFNRIIKESQKTDISTEYLEMRPQHASLRGVNEENLQIALSPYANRSVVPK